MYQKYHNKHFQGLLLLLELVRQRPLQQQAQVSLHYNHRSKGKEELCHKQGLLRLKCKHRLML
jgi:hypothetical protein